MEILEPDSPTGNLELNAVLRELVTSVQKITGANFIGAYLQGSFALGDWDIYSDVDFLIVIEHEATAMEEAGLQAMHARGFELDSNWAKHLEGSYFPKELIRRADPARTPLLYIDNGSRQLTRSTHDNDLVVRWVTRDYGIPILGPDPKELIDPVPVDDLRQEVMATMRTWAEEIFAGRYKFGNRWVQPFAVLSYCRMLHTLETGKVGSKPAGAQWAKEVLDPRWRGLIQRAWGERPDPSWKVQQEADPLEVESTLEFIRYSLDIIRE